jgi:hypothetical protein
MVDAIIEDLVITTRSSRESDGVRRRGCIEHEKIFTGAKPFLKAYMKPFDVTKIEMHTSFNARIFI